MKQKELMEHVTDQIVKVLETDQVEKWMRPWTVFGAARNFATSRRYEGLVNLFLLSMNAELKGFPYPAWATFNQITGMGGAIRKGERSTPIVFWKRLDTRSKDAKSHEEQSVAGADEKSSKSYRYVLQYFNVFNLHQTTLDAEFILQALGMTLRSETSNATLDNFVMSQGVKLDHAGDRAYYDRYADAIRLPIRGAFQTDSDYYSTLFHELVHWTGHESRLNRIKGETFGDEAYAKEEIVAELGSLYLCAELGIDGRLQHKEYLHHWLQPLKKDTREVFRLAGQAQKAALYLLERFETKAAVA